MTEFKDENYKIVNVGPETTPEMRAILETILVGLLRQGIASALNPEAVKIAVEAATDRIEILYRGIGQGALEDIKKVIKQRNEL